MSTSPTQIVSLFVYGTLLSASKHPMARLLRERSQRLGAGFFTGRLYDLGSYPGAVYDPDTEGRVYGEIYQLNESDADNLLQILDSYEGDEYTRAVVPVTTNNNLIMCWTYLFTQPTDLLPLIASGRYFDPA